MAFKYQYEDGSILEFSKEPTLKEIEQAGINAGAIKPSFKQKYENVMQGGFQSIVKMGTGLLRTGNVIGAAIDPFNTLEDYAKKAKGRGMEKFIPGTEAAKRFNAEIITPQNKYEARGQLAGDIGQFFLAAPATGLSAVQRLAVAPLIDTAIQVTQDMGAGTTGKDLFRNAMLTAGTSIMAGVFQPTKNINWMKMGASGALTGYVADVATGLSGMRGEDREGLNSLIPGAGTVVGGGIGLGTGALTRFSATGKKQKILDNRESALNQLEIDHKDIRKAFDNARETGYDPKNVLMYSDALNNSTTRSGKIDMTKALAKLDVEMEPMEPHVLNRLKEDGTTITPKQFAKGLIDVLQESRLQLDERALLQRKIANLIEVGKQVAKENGGVIPLWKVQSRKISLGAQLRKQYGTTKGSTNKEIARAYKQIVETYTTSMEVKKYNEILQQLYTFRTVLNALNGKVIEGGRLGRHVQTLLGTYVGGQIAGAPGAIVGGQMGYSAKGAFNKRYFGLQSTPMIKKGSFDIAKKATDTQSRNILGKTNQAQSKKTTKVKKVIPKSVSQKNAPKADKMKPRTVLTKIKDKVNTERAKTRSLIRRTGSQRGGINNPEALPEEVRKLTVMSPENLTVNEKFQIIDESKTGADALVGLVGKDLSPELRQEVIKASKAGNDAKLQALAPRILAELQAKALRQNQVSTQSPEEIARNRAKKLRTEAEQRKQTAVRSNQIQIGLSPVQGMRRQKWDDMYDEAEKLRVAGDLAGARRIHSQIITEGKEAILKRAKGSPFEKQITFNGVGYGVFEGNPEPNIDFVVNIKPGQEELLHKFLADLSKNDFVQKSVLTYKVKPQGDYPLGVIDETTGIANEPHFMFFPDEPLTLERVTAFNEILDSVGLQAMSIKDGGRRVDIIHLSAYDSANDYNGFKQKLISLQEALNERGFLGVSERGVAETRLIGDSRESQNISYERNQREFLQRNPTFLKGNETIDSPVLDALRYQASISKSDFENLLETSNIGEVEKKVYQSVIKNYPADAQISPKGLYGLLKKKVLKIAPAGEMGDYVGYGWSRLLGDSEIKYEFKTKKINTDLPITLDDINVLHTRSGDVAQFGHFRYAVKKSKGREVFFGETQNDPFQQTAKFERVKSKIMGDKVYEASYLKEKIASRQERIQDRKTKIERAKREIEESEAGNDMNHRVVREGRHILAKLNEWLDERGLNTTLTVGANGGTSYGDRFAWMDAIVPREIDGVQGYDIKIAWEENGVQLEDTRFIPTLTPGEPIVPSSGTYHRIDINNEPNSARSSLKKLVDSREETLEESTRRYIEEREATINDSLIDIDDYQKDIVALKKKLAQIKKPDKVDLRRDQYLNFKRNDNYIKRQYQEEIESVIKEEKPKKIFLPTPSTTAKIEGYFPDRNIKEKPNYSYGGGFGSEAPEIVAGAHVEKDGIDHTVIKSWSDSFNAIPTEKLETIELPAGTRNRYNFVKKNYKENILKKITNDYLEHGRSAEDISWAQSLTLDTPITYEQRSNIYATTRGDTSKPFGSRSYRTGDFWDIPQDGTKTIDEILNHYFKKQGIDRYTLDTAFSKRTERGRQEVTMTDNPTILYRYYGEDTVRLQQPKNLSDEITTSFEERFDSSKDVIRESMSEGNAQEVVLHRFDDIKNIYPQLEKQFGQPLKPWTDPDTNNTWLYWEPDYKDPKWTNIKKTTF